MTFTCVGCAYCKPTIHRDRLVRRCRKHGGLIRWKICADFLPRFLEVRRKTKKMIKNLLQASFSF